jgi:uncharacterized membrane protein YfcA
MTDFLPPHLIPFVIATFAGALVAGIGGFAFGLVASAIWLHFITPAQSAPLIAAFAIVIQGCAVWKLRHAIEPRQLLPLLAGGAIGIPLGATALQWLPAAQIRLIIGVVSIAFGLYGLLQPRLRPVKGGPFSDTLVGVASGVLGGSTGLVGIPPTIWTTLRGWPKDKQRAVFQPAALAIFILTLAWFGSTGVLTPDTARLFLIGLPPLLLGTWLGLTLYGRLNDAVFRRVVLVLLLCSGAALAFGG